MKAELIDTIDSVINDKSAFAAMNAAKTAFIGEPSELPINGTHEMAEKVNPRSAYAAYRKLLSTGHVEIMAAGCSDFEESREIFTKAFAALNRDPEAICKPRRAPSALKAEPVYVTDKMPMQQAILRVYLKTNEDVYRYANKMFGVILGGMTTSRFFMNIREKQSLCYYCSCIPATISRTLTCYAGVEPCNIKKAEEAMLAEIRDISENGVTREELECAKRELSESYSAMSDSASSLIQWYMGQITDGDFISPEEYFGEISKVTAEDVRKIAAKYSTDTVYVLMSEDNDD